MQNEHRVLPVEVAYPSCRKRYTLQVHLYHGGAAWCGTPRSVVLSESSYDVTCRKCIDGNVTRGAWGTL